MLLFQLQGKNGGVNMATNSEKLVLSQLGLYHMIQPIVDILTNKVIGYELLLRSSKFQNPRLLFNNAKRHGQCYELDMLSIKKAFILINKYHQSLQGLRIFINVLPTTVNHPRFFSNLQRLKSTLKLDTQNIVFEITEDDKESTQKSIQSYVTKLKRLGFLVALDDFGQGDSTIQYVQSLNPHIVKLDRYYTAGLAESFQRQTLIGNMLFLLKGEAEFIIEGVETEADLQTAKSLGVRYAQGFYLGRPKRVEHYISKR